MRFVETRSRSHPVPARSSPWSQEADFVEEKLLASGLRFVLLLKVTRNPCLSEM